MSKYIVIILVAIVAALFFLNKVGSSKEIIQPQKFKELLSQQGGIVIDVRTPAEHTSGHIRRTDYNFDISSSEFERKISDLDKSENYYLYCRSGNRSGKAAKRMRQQGFENVYNVGGFKALVNGGFESSK